MSTAIPADEASAPKSTSTAPPADQAKSTEDAASSAAE